VLRTFSFLVLYVLASAFSRGEELSAKPTPLLGGRLLLRLPPGAQIQAMQEGLMAAAESPEEETRAIWDSGPHRLVILALECFETCPRDFAGTAAAAAERWSRNGPRKFAARTHTAPTGQSAEIVLLIPDRLVPNPDEAEAILVRGAFVMGADRTVQLVQIFANPAFARDEIACTSLAEAICASAAAGKKPLALEAGERILPWLEKGKALRAAVPAGYLVTRQGGPDFLVYRFRKLGVFGQDRPRTGIGVYLGEHPSSFHEKYAEAGAEAREPAAGKLLGKEASWHAWRLPDDPPGLLRQEAAVAAETLGKGMVAHIFWNAGGDQEAEELQAIARSLQFRTVLDQPEL
jgi:hypothetical protein